MKKKIELRLIEINSEIRKIEESYDNGEFCVSVEWKVANAKRELLIELKNEI